MTDTDQADHVVGGSADAAVDTGVDDGAADRVERGDDGLGVVAGASAVAAASDAGEGEGEAGRSMRTAFRTCPLCEAGCGLEITLRRAADGSEEVARIRGDREDVFSRGFICPKGSTLKHLHEDPDRVRRPLVKGGDGAFVEVSWAEAWAAVDVGLQRVIDAHGRDAVASYLGNPGAHNIGSILYAGAS